MQNVPLGKVLRFDLDAAILGWLPTRVVELFFTVPVPTFEKVMVPVLVPVPSFEKLRFRFWFQLHI